jgi:hypothetical protein
MRALMNGEQHQNQEFLALLNKQEQLFQRQQEAAEFLNDNRYSHTIAT